MSARVYAGGAAATTLSSGITSSSTTIGVTDASTWPATGAFSIVLDRGLAGEEKVLIASRSGNTLTAGTRGYDGTSAAAHTSGAVAECCGTAIDFQEANDHVNASTNVHGLTGGAAVVGTTQTQTLTNKALTQPTIADFTNANHTHASTAQGGSLSFAALSTYTPVIAGTGWAVGNGTVSGRYFQLGKLTWVDIYWDLGSTSTIGSALGTFTLPVAADTTIQPGGFPYLDIAGTAQGNSGSVIIEIPSVRHSSSGSVVIPQAQVTVGTQVRINDFDSGDITADSAAYMRMSGWYVSV